MILGLLPAIRGGLGDLARTGQHTRLIHSYFLPYARAFDEVRYFSYLPETLGTYTDDPAVLARVTVVPGAAAHPWAYTLLMAARHAKALRGCAVLRVYQVTGALPAVITKARAGVPFVVTYGFWYETLARSPATALLRRAVAYVGLRAADAVIVTTPELRAHVAARVGAAKVHLVPNGVDTMRFKPAERTAKGVAHVVYVGRLSPEKDLPTLLKAVARVASAIPVRVTLVGQGPQREALGRLATTLELAVDFVPMVEHTALPALLAQADVFVLPSLTEGHPKVLLEAMSAGVPCVASDVAGNRAILAHHDGLGFLFPVRDVEGLTQALRRMLEDAPLARTVAQRARRHVEDHYALDRLVQREIDLLHRVARRGGTARLEVRSEA